MGRSTRDIVTSKRPAEEMSGAEMKVTGKPAAIPQTEPVTSEPAPKTVVQEPEAQPVPARKKQHIKLLLPLLAGCMVVLGLMAALLLARQAGSPETDPKDGCGIIAVSVDAAVADLVQPGDIVRLYDTDGMELEPLQYVKVYKSADKELLLEVSKFQAATIVSRDINPKMVVVAHNASKKADQLLELQARINDPTITLKLESAASLKPEESLQLKPEAVIDPVEASLPPIQWATSNPEVVTVDEKGVIHAVTVGEATITASCGEVKAESKITVEVPLEAIALGQTEAALGIGETVTVSAAAQPENATRFDVVWTSADPNVATVDEAGNITAVAAGSTVITATSGSVKAECQVKVGNRADVVKLDTTELAMKVSETKQLSGTVYPEADVIDEAVFASSDPAIATVAADGTVTAVASGSCTITFKAGNATAACTVTVE